MKEDLNIKGRVIVHEGIPFHLIKERGNPYLEALSKKNNNIDVEKFITNKKPLKDDSNIITTSGKDKILSMIFDGGSPFKYISIGDGGFTFNANGTFNSPPRFPLFSDQNLQSQIGGKSIDIIEPWIKRGENGLETTLITTFFSDQDIGLGSNWNVNNSNFYINEVGICATENLGVFSDLLSIFVLGNQSLSPITPTALTIEWRIRIY